MRNVGKRQYKLTQFKKKYHQPQAERKETKVKKRKVKPFKSKK